VERRDLYEDDLTEEREPSPEHRDDVAESETLDPDEPGDDDRGSAGDAAERDH
jgi:hypothetical protein